MTAKQQEQMPDEIYMDEAGTWSTDQFDDEPNNEKYRYVRADLCAPTDKEAEDLAKRLRVKADIIQMGERIQWGSDSEIMREAAESLTRPQEIDVEALKREMAIAADKKYSGNELFDGPRTVNNPSGLFYIGMKFAINHLAASGNLK